MEIFGVLKEEQINMNNQRNISVFTGVTPTVSPTVLIPGDGTTLWVDKVGVTASLGKILPSTTGIGWDKSGGFGSVPANTAFTLSFGFEYMAGQSSNGFIIAGISSTTSSANWTHLTHAFYFNAGYAVSFAENGSTFNITPTPSFAISDTFEIKRVQKLVSGTLQWVISYYKNGVLLHESANYYSGIVYFDCSINRFLGLNNLSLTF